MITQRRHQTYSIRIPNHISHSVVMVSLLLSLSIDRFHRNCLESKFRDRSGDVGCKPAPTFVMQNQKWTTEIFICSLHYKRALTGRDRPFQFFLTPKALEDLYRQGLTSLLHCQPYFILYSIPTIPCI